MDGSSRRWHGRHVLLWLLLAGLVCCWRGPAYRRAFEVEFYPPGVTFFQPDFFQEWASARNRFNGLPIYAPHEITLERCLGLRRNPVDRYFIEVNAHPPTALGRRIERGVPKAQVALAALKGQRKVNELARQFGVHPPLIHEWKRRLLAAAEGVFANGAKTDTVEAEARQAKLFEQIGRLKMELEWLKKKLS